MVSSTGDQDLAVELQKFESALIQVESSILPAFINLISGFLNPDSGKIKIDGEEVTNYPIYLRTKKLIRKIHMEQAVHCQVL